MMVFLVCTWHTCSFTKSNFHIDSEIVLQFLTPFFLAAIAALSPEEERLWSIVNTNSLDFTAWTALIEETEKTAEVGIRQGFLLQV